MYLLRLFHHDDPAQPIAAHLLTSGVTRVGRDPNVEWVIPDPECEVSRTHLELVCGDGGLMLRPLGANGVFTHLGAQLPQGNDVPLVVGDAISFGKFRMVVDAPPASEPVAGSDNATMIGAAPFGADPSVPFEWPEEAVVPLAEAEDSLLEAFCRGADLDVSAFSSEDPAEAMVRAGAIYRQMILGLGDLMCERSSAKADHRLERTTISGCDNNPFKWAPSRRLATDLLLRRDAGFLPGPEAIRASFVDVKRHMIGTLAGFRAAIAAVIAAGRPKAIEERVAGEKSMLQSRSAACWADYARLHGEFEREYLDGREGPINAAFVAAYEARLEELNRVADAQG